MCGHRWAQNRETTSSPYPSAMYARRRRPSNSCQPRAEGLSHDLLHYVSVNFREPFFTALMQIAKRILIQPELIEDGGMNVAQVAGIFDSVQADGIGRAHHLAAFNATAGQPHGKAQVVMVAAFAAL